ncbi:MAG: sigma-E processing peptidase SpoIIGA [Lachnospiraceae bacterium]
MQYEVYIDSLFLLNFAMNLYLMILVNESLHGAATKKRLVAGAAIGGAGYCLMFFLPVSIVPVRVLFGAVIVNAVMLLFTFRAKNIRFFLKLLEKAYLYAFIYGGFFLALLHLVPQFAQHMLTVGGVLLLGGFLFLILLGKLHKRRGDDAVFVQIGIRDKKERIRYLTGLVDTGNTLREPISKQPVCIMETKDFQKLFPEGLAGGRVIPFRSIGCATGILWGYPLPELRIEVLGKQHVCRDVYIGVSENKISAQGKYQMLVHPACMER